MLALSFAAWTLAQISLDLVPRAWDLVDGGFPFSAWQLLFFLGQVSAEVRDAVPGDP